MASKNLQQKEQQAKYQEWLNSAENMEGLRVDDHSWARCVLCDKVIQPDMEAEVALRNHLLQCWVHFERLFLRKYSDYVQPRGDAWQCKQCYKCIIIDKSSPEDIWQQHETTQAHTKAKHQQDKYKEGGQIHWNHGFSGR